MRNPEVIMNTVGDSPLIELMELDEIYGWTARIEMLGSVLSNKREKRSAWPYVALAVVGVAALASIGAGIYLYFFY